ncbi:hypothetical protein IVB57_09570 [Bradyrhizobium sp. CW9]|uniref:hypothetical protein n=1 Tax=Bradyrhizobium sp. CW9 TaxID=2782689 RepID=UPI001FF97E68|nr:hypothetical protein [Bradyrhizobium sp. CW9]MCK1328637.1 hypothetical protein [Bradyrhizobium sp. CW9]
MQAFGWFRRQIPWSALNAVSKSPSARMTILIPLIGYLIIFNDKVAEYLRLNPQLQSLEHASNSLSPRLMVVYIGLCAMAVGVALYKIFCPGEVSYYTTSSAYVRGDGPGIKDFVFEEIENKLRASVLNAAYHKLRDRYERNTYAITDEQKAEINNGILHLYFRLLNYSWPPIRYLVALFYLVGFVCLLFPSLGVFWKVLQVLWKLGPMSAFTVG